MAESVCWVFDVSPSKLGRIIWSNSHHDIEIRTKLKVGFQQSLVVQNYQTLALVVSQALGGKAAQSAPPSGSNDPGVMRPKTVAEMSAAFEAVFGNGR